MKLIGVTIFLAVLLLLSVACGQTSTPNPSATSTPRPSSTSILEAIGITSPKEKPTVIFSDLNWDSAQVQTAIAKKIVSDGYGYPTDAVFGGTVPLFNTLVRGDTNVTMEIWLPYQLEAYNAAIGEGTITRIGRSLEDNWQSTFVIPNYVAEAYPGLKTPQDLRDHMDLFVTPDSKGKARLLNCVPGWECEQVNLKKIAAYGLEDVVEPVNPGSGEALAAAIRAAFEKRDPVLFYYWGPTTLTYDLDTKYGGYTILEEPYYSDECWEGDGGCAYPLAEVLVVMRTDLVEQAPDLKAFFKKWDFSAGNQFAAEGYMAKSGADVAEVADWFLANTDEWKSWVTADALEKIEASLTPTSTPRPSATSIPKEKPSASWSSKEAYKHIGERGTVCGPIVDTRYATGSSGKPTFLNFDRAYPNHTMVVVIWHNDRGDFPNNPQTYYDGKDVCATGLIESYKGKPEIIARDRGQLAIQR